MDALSTTAADATVMLQCGNTESSLMLDAGHDTVLAFDAQQAFEGGASITDFECGDRIILRNVMTGNWKPTRSLSPCRALQCPKTSCLSS